MRINQDKEIEINRGDRGTLKLINKKGNFEIGDKLKFSIVDKKEYNNLIFQKEFIVTENSNVTYITLTKEDTTIGDVISKKKEYWYEIEYNGDLTILGFDDDGAKKFILYPEAPIKGSD